MKWFDNSSSSLEEKIKKAIAAYREKYGDPSVCYVNDKVAEPITVDGVRVIGSASILPSHFEVE